MKGYMLRDIRTITPTDRISQKTGGNAYSSVVPTGAAIHDNNEASAKLPPNMAADSLR